jgi:hypothetical protein
MRTPLQGVGHLQRVYGHVKVSCTGRRVLSPYRGCSGGIQRSKFQPSAFQQAEAKRESQTNTFPQYFSRAKSSITVQIDDNLLNEHDTFTSSEQAGEVGQSIPDSYDAICQMQLEEFTKLIANLRLKSNIKQKAQSFEQVFAELDIEQASSLQELVKSKINFSGSQVNASVWLCCINILAHCQNWEDVMIELHSAVNSKVMTDDSVTEGLIRTDVPFFALEHAFTMIRNARHASEACSLLSDSMDTLTMGDAIKLYHNLNDLIMNDLQATYLTGLLTSITVRIASRLVHTSERQADPDTSASNFGQIEALKIIRHQIQSLIPWPFGHIRRHVQRLLNWADYNLSLDHCDILRMQVLGCETAESELHLPWQEIMWVPSTHRSFPNSVLALDLVERLYENKRLGAGMQFALQSALYIATQSRSEAQSAKLVRKAERLYKSKRIGIEFFKSTAFLRELVMTGQKEKATQLFDIILTTNEEAGNSTRVEVWASIIGMLANIERLPNIALRILDSNDESKVHLSPGCVAIQKPSANVLTQPFVYAKVIQQIALRKDSNYADQIRNIWNLMLARGIKPDVHCFEEYCVALVRQGCKVDALSMLDRCEEKYIPRSGFVYRLMKCMIEQGETQQVFRLYQESSSKGQQETDVVLLPTLLRAAKEASVKQERRGYSDNHPFIARMLFQRTDPLKDKDFLWDGIPAPLKARQMFRQALFDSYPDLCNLPNPLDDNKTSKRVGLWRNEIRMQKFEEWLSSKLSFERGNSRQEQFSSLTLQSNNDRLEINQGNGSVQRVMLQCTHDLFENYLRLLPYVEDCAREIGMGSGEKDHLQIGWEERLIVISWMRYLDIFPNKSCLCLICTYIQERMPPALGTSNNQDPYSYSNHSAAGPLHGFLADWLGEENIPTNEDVAIFIRNSRPL